MELPPSEKNKQTMRAMGIEDDEMSNQMLIAISAFQKAVKGNIRAMEFIRDVMGGRDMNELDKANMERIKAETKRIKVETDKIASNIASGFDASDINELNKSVLENVAPTRELEDFE